MRAIVVAAVLVGTPLAADADDEPAPPVPTSVRGHLDGATARFAVRYSIPVAASYVPGAVTLAYPASGVITGATVTLYGRSHRATFTTNEDSQAAFDKLLTSDQPDPHGSMIRLSGGSGSISIDIAAASAGRLTLDLELSMPSCFHRDIRYVSLPKDWAAALEPALRRAPRAPDEEVAAACGASFDHEAVTWLGFASGELAARPPGDRRIDGIAMRLPLGDRDLARVELDLAREISAVPADLHTAIVIDNSRSVSGREAEVQRAIVASYLRHAPQSHVQVIAFAHKARAVLPGWTAAAQAAPRIDREIGALVRRNGSDVDVALAEAAAWLGRVEGTKRILLFTDERLAQRLLDAKPAELRRVLSPDTLVHVVALTEDRGTLERAEDTILAGLASETQGVAVRGKLDDKDQVDATMLVRPITLDHPKLDAPGWNTLEIGDATACALGEDAASLKEGDSCTWIGEGTAASGPVILDGLLWGRPFRRILRPDPSQARTLARVLTAIGGFDKDIQLRIDQLAYAINSVWSLSATWGEPGGYTASDSFGFGRGGFGACGGGTGSSDTFGFGHGGFVQSFDLAKQFEAAIRSCNPKGARVTLDLETTFQEIVGVEVHVDSMAQAPTTLGVLHDCIEAAVWDTEASFPNAQAHDTMSFAY